MEVREGQETAWLAQAFGIYREAVASGVKPSMRMLNRVLMCLRVAYEGKVRGWVPGGGLAEQAVDGLLGTDRQARCWSRRSTSAYLPAFPGSCVCVPLTFCCFALCKSLQVTPTGVPGAPDSLLPHQLPAQLGSFTAGAAAAAAGGKKVSRQEKIGVESVYHVQAISILEEAIIR